VQKTAGHMLNIYGWHSEPEVVSRRTITPFRTLTGCSSLQSTATYGLEARPERPQNSKVENRIAVRKMQYNRGDGERHTIEREQRT
jgi:hypothetical protein